MQQFRSSQKFDLFLLSESQSYFDPTITFKKAHRYLKKGGYILISDMFSKHPSENFIDYTEKKYISEAKEFGFDLIYSLDITDNVLPTVHLMHGIYSSYIVPLLNIILSYYKNTSPLKYFVIRLFFNKQITDALKLKKYLDNRLDPKFFKGKMAYKRLLFKYRHS